MARLVKILGAVCVFAAVMAACAESGREWPWIGLGVAAGALMRCGRTDRARGSGSLPSNILLAPPHASRDILTKNGERRSWPLGQSNGSTQERDSASFNLRMAARQGRQGKTSAVNLKAP
jgi:hypothetical protein